MASSVVVSTPKTVDTTSKVETGSSTETLRSHIFELFEIPYTDFRRRYPKIGMSDTRGGFEKPDFSKLEKILESFSPKETIPSLFPELGKLSTLGAHGYANSYSDKSILKVYPVTHSMKIIQEPRSVTVYFTENKKPIIQQQSTRGCSAAATAMLILEHEKPIDLVELTRRNLGTPEKKIKDLENAGLTPLSTRCATLADLQECLKKQGPAIVSVDSGAGSHSIILDALSESSTRIRDPYHGWEIEITLDAFRNSWDPSSSILQVG